MAKRLTEEMVIARSKLSDLSKVKRLNCWGSELVDVSLLRKMPSVEVLSLSINKINSLADFQYCSALQELYIRQNDIRDLNQICYLQKLPNLKNLWLGENPCANIESYRLTVLKALPQLQKLDNITVSEDEVKEATRKGKILIHPDDHQESDEDEYVPQNQHKRYQEYSAESDYSPRQSPTCIEPDYENDDIGDNYTKDENTTESGDYSPPRQLTPPKQDNHRPNFSSDQVYEERHSKSFEHEYPKSNSYYDKSYNVNNSNEDSSEISYLEPKISTSQSTNCIKDYANGDKFSQVSHNYRGNDGNEITGHNHDMAIRRERYSCPAALQPPFNRRPVTRNSNILSAVLCLVKELDYPSLEVVEMAVRCRMDELEG